MPTTSQTHAHPETLTRSTLQPQATLHLQHRHHAKPKPSPRKALADFTKIVTNLYI